MKKLTLIVIALSAFLQACEKASNQDIVAFIEETKRRQPADVKAPAVYAPYEPYVYNAAQLRSPFEPPAVIQKRELAANSNVKPNLNRQKERLESYEFTTLSMVGTVQKKGVLWALIRDPDGGIERVRQGSYLGRNHGKIVTVEAQKIDVVEIVSDGYSGWLERPNLITMKEE